MASDLKPKSAGNPGARMSRRGNPAIAAKLAWYQSGQYVSRFNLIDNRNYSVCPRVEAINLERLLGDVSFLYMRHH